MWFAGSRKTTAAYTSRPGTEANGPGPKPGQDRRHGLTHRPRGSALSNHALLDCDDDSGQMVDHFRRAVVERHLKTVVILGGTGGG